MGLQRILPHDLSSPAEARRAIRSFLRSADLPKLEEDAELLASELVTNAVRHARGPVEVRAEVRDDHLHLEVRDGSVDQVPHPRHADDEDEGGRGLDLVAKLAVRWGWRTVGQVKTVWLDLPIRR